MRSSRIFRALIVSVIVSSAIPVSADESQSTPATQPSTTQQQPVTGGVTKTVVPAQVGLKEMGDTAKHLHKATLGMVGELTRQDLVVVGEPDVIGPIVMPAIPIPSGMLAMGDYLPPRKKWVDFFNYQIGTLVNEMQKELTSMSFPPDQMQQVTPLWNEIIALVADMTDKTQKLIDISKGPNYDRKAMGILTMNIYDDTTNFERPWKELVKLMRK